MSLDPLSRPQSVFALQKELSRETERQLHQAQLQRAAQAAARKPDDAKRRGLPGRALAYTPCASPSTRSAARAAAKRTKTAWAIATRATSGLFALADGMGGHPEGEVASQLALQTLAALFQREAQADAAGPAALPARGGHRRPPPAAALRDPEGADRHAAHDHRRLPAAGQRRLLGALRRLAALPGARRQADRAHARPLVLRAAADDEPGRADGRPLQPQRALHLPGQPRQAGGRHRRPAAAAERRPPAAVLRRPLGHGQRRRHHRPARDPAALRFGARARRAGAAQRRRQERQRLGARDRVGTAEDGDSDRAASRPTALGDGVFASTIQAGVLGTMRPTSSTTPRSSARSRRSTRRSSARRSTRRR